MLVTLIASSRALPAACIDAGVASVEADYAAALAAIPDGRAKTRGIEVGQAAAAAILALRAADGSDTPLFDTASRRAPRPGVPLHARQPVRVRARLGDVTPFVLETARSSGRARRTR